MWFRAHAPPGNWGRAVKGQARATRAGASGRGTLQPDLAPACTQLCVPVSGRLDGHCQQALPPVTGPLPRVPGRTVRSTVTVGTGVGWALACRHPRHRSPHSQRGRCQSTSDVAATRGQRRGTSRQDAWRGAPPGTHRCAAAPPDGVGKAAPPPDDRAGRRQSSGPESLKHSPSADVRASVASDEEAMGFRYASAFKKHLRGVLIIIQ